MANTDQLTKLKQDVGAWNAWRGRHPDLEIDLSGADLSGQKLAGSQLGGANLANANLAGANLLLANLTKANLSGADLTYAMLSKAFLDGADLRNATLKNADLRKAELKEAKLGKADLNDANLGGAYLLNADLSSSNLSGTVLRDATLSGSNLTSAFIWNVDLRQADLSGTIFKNATLAQVGFGENFLAGALALETCNHLGPSTVDQLSLQYSKNVPKVFWRGCGLPDWQIATIKLYQPNLSQADINDVTDEIFWLRAEQPIQLYSCFISYSSKDHAFAKRLHDDLQDAGVRLWFDKHDLKTGDRLRDVIDQAVRTRDKLLLILSKASIASEWVENEVETALEEERSSPDRRTILFPIKIDDAVMETKLPWARMIKRDRRITDMTRWNEETAYQQGLEYLLRDLRADRDKSP